MTEAIRGQAINWPRIRVEYVANKGHKGVRKVSLSTLALIHDIPISAIEKRASDRGWEDERREFERNVYEETLKRIEAEKTNLGVMAISTWAEDLERFRKQIMETVRANESEEKEGEPLTPSEIRTLMGAYKDCKREVETALGMKAKLGNRAVADVIIFGIFERLTIVFEEINAIESAKERAERFGRFLVEEATRSDGVELHQVAIEGPAG